MTLYRLVDGYGDLPDASFVLNLQDGSTVTVHVSPTLNTWRITSDTLNDSYRGASGVLSTLTANRLHGVSPDRGLITVRHAHFYAAMSSALLEDKIIEPAPVHPLFPLAG